MAPSFVACDREQPFLLPPDVRDWLPEDHFVWFVLDAVERIDMAAFYAAYRRDGRCRPAYEPAMMLALLLYAYARGTRSSRVIERACVEDVAFRVIAAQQRPDHATIARFVERHQRALADVFGAVLGLCARAGLLGGVVVAIDGTKLHANASRAAMSFRRRSRPARAGRSGCVRRSARSMSAGRASSGRSRARARSGSRSHSAGSRSS